MFCKSWVFHSTKKQYYCKKQLENNIKYILELKALVTIKQFDKINKTITFQKSLLNLDLIYNLPQIGQNSSTSEVIQVSLFHKFWHLNQIFFFFFYYLFCNTPIRVFCSLNDCNITFFNSMVVAEAVILPVLGDLMQRRRLSSYFESLHKLFMAGRSSTIIGDLYSKIHPYFI